MIASLTLAAIIGIPASAQNSTTTCARMGTYIECNTQTQPQHQGGPENFLGAMGTLPDPADAFAKGQQQAAQLRQQQFQNQIAEEQLAEQRRLADGRSERQQADAIRMAEAIRENESRATNRREVINRVMAGDCAGAINLALMSGDMDFATKTKVFCSSGDAPHPSH